METKTEGRAISREVGKFKKKREQKTNQEEKMKANGRKRRQRICRMM